MYGCEFSSVQSLSCDRLLATPWTAVCQASITNSNMSLLKLTFIELVMPSNHLIPCRPLLLLPTIFPSIRVFSNESALHIRWPKYWSFSFSISSSNEYSGLKGHESWTIKKGPRIDTFELWCWRRLESPLDCKEIQPAHPEGNQPWIFIGRTDAEAEAPILWLTR